MLKRERLVNMLDLGKCDTEKILRDFEKDQKAKEEEKEKEKLEEEAKL